jgi:hypothetical protein
MMECWQNVFYLNSIYLRREIKSTPQFKYIEVGPGVEGGRGGEACKLLNYGSGAAISCSSSQKLPIRSKDLIQSIGRGLLYKHNYG